MILYKDGVSSISVTHGEFGAVKMDGSLYIWLNEDEKHKIPLPDKAVRVSCASSFTGVVLSNGDLYMWGDNYSGQLGNGTKSGISEPTKIEIPSSSRVVKVVCANATTGALTEDGDLYMWGSNGDGHLGIGTRKDIYIPKRVEIPGRVIDFSTGYMNSGAVTENGDLYMWGSNGDGQLGDNKESRIGLSPKKINFPGKVVQISCGLGYAGAVTEDGKLYMWGSNDYKQLGKDTTGVAEYLSVPTELEMPDKSPVVKIICNRYISGAITEDGKLYMWGDVGWIYSKFGGGVSSIPRDIRTAQQNFDEPVHDVAFVKNYIAIIAKDRKLYTHTLFQSGWERSEFK